MKRCIILNPWAGRGTAGQRQGELEQALRTHGVAFDLVTTHARGGATELTYQALIRGYQQIIAVGGDGTINEIVNALADGRERTSRPPALGIVPIGTGSDFIKMLDTFEANDIDSAVRRIANGHTRSIDLGRMTVETKNDERTRYFINGLGMGIDAQVAVESLKLTRLKGLAVYLVAVIRALTIYRANPMTVHFDEREVRHRLLFTTVANGRCQGGGFWMTPEAILDDGLLDICTVDNMRLDEIIRYIPRLMEGTHTTLRQVTMGRARHVEVTSNTPIPVATDGEVVATHAHRVVVDVVPGAIDIIV